MSIETIKTMDLVTRLQASAAATVGTYSNLVPMTAASQNDLMALTAGKIPAGFKNAELSDKASEQIAKKAGKTWTPSRVLTKSSKNTMAFWIEFNYNGQAKNPLTTGVIGQYYFDGGAAYATIVLEGASKKYVKAAAKAFTAVAESKDLDMGQLMDALSKMQDIHEAYDKVNTELESLGGKLNVLFVKKTKKNYDALINN